MTVDKIQTQQSIKFWPSHSYSWGEKNPFKWGEKRIQKFETSPYFNYSKNKCDRAIEMEGKEPRLSRNEMWLGVLLILDWFFHDSLLETKVQKKSFILI